MRQHATTRVRHRMRMRAGRGGAPEIMATKSNDASQCWVSSRGVWAGAPHHAGQPTRCRPIPEPLTKPQNGACLSCLCRDSRQIQVHQHGRTAQHILWQHRVNDGLGVRLLQHGITAIRSHGAARRVRVAQGQLAPAPLGQERFSRTQTRQGRSRTALALGVAKSRSEAQRTLRSQARPHRAPRDLGASRHPVASRAPSPSGPQQCAV